MKRYLVSILTGAVTLCLLTVVKLKAPYQMLIADRFLPGSGWAEIAALGVYGFFVARALQKGTRTASVRLKIWLTFSIVFFTQFILGIAGVDSFLMTGRLHVPVPAVVIAGPIFRGERFFMPVLFLITVVLVGPAWCSYLCYFGSWDYLAASRKARAGTIGRAWPVARFAIFALTPAVAILLRLAGAGGNIAAYAAIGFGVTGLGVSVFISSRRATMVHCSSFCPLGLAGNILGKISPFRIRIGSSCTECGHCIPTCRYNALSATSITKRKPGYNCTLCGDCLQSCPHGALSYGFINIKPETARSLFIVIVAALHAVFLGVARI